MDRPDTTIGMNCGYLTLRGRKLTIAPSMYAFVADCSYGVCKADCCAHGCWVSTSREDKIAEHFEGITEYLEDNVPRKLDELIVSNPVLLERGHNDPIYEGMITKDSKMVKDKGAWNHGYCAFLTKKHDGIPGCAIHKYLHNSGAEDWHDVKPLGCILFPAKARISKSSGDVQLTRRRWGDSRCCQLVNNPKDGHRAVDIQRKSISKLFDIPEDRLQQIIDWYRPASDKAIEDDLNPPADNQLTVIGE